MSNIKRNFIYNSILTSANYIFPFITYPYVSRVLGVNNIGICNFIDGIINYFILFSMLGIGIVGVREIAKVKSNRKLLNETFSSLFILNGITTLIALILLLSSINYFPQLTEHKTLIYIGASKLLCNFLLIEWLYTGLEDFKYITKRTIIVKCFYVIGVFSFVKEINDYPIYFFLLCSMVVINSIFNLLYARKLVSLSFKRIQLKSYLSPFFILGLYMILTSMYTSFNITYLGFVSGTREVGYYTTATKIYSILLSLFTAFTNVMLPRMSTLIENGNINEFKILIKKSIDFLFIFSTPIIVISMIFAPEIILLVSGKGYEGAITPMRIVMPLMIIIGYAQIIIIQILMPLKKDKAIFIGSMIGAIVGISLNILLVPYLHSIGSALVWVISEFTILLIGQYKVYHYIKISFPYKQFMRNITYILPIIILYFILSKYILLHNIKGLFIASFIICIYWLFINIYVSKNTLVIEMLRKIHLIK